MSQAIETWLISLKMKVMDKSSFQNYVINMEQLFREGMLRLSGQSDQAVLTHASMVR